MTRLTAVAAALVLAVSAGCGSASAPPPSTSPSTAPAPARALAVALRAVRTPALAAAPDEQRAARTMRGLSAATGPAERSAAARVLIRTAGALERSAGAVRVLPSQPPAARGGLLAASYSQAAGALRRIAHVLDGRAHGLDPARAGLGRAARRALAWQRAVIIAVRAAGGTPPAWLASPRAAIQDMLRAARAMRLPAPPPTGGLTTRSITELQRRLSDLTFLPAGYRTGVYDYRTAQAVIAFQGWQNIARDGVAGPQTLRRLAGAQRPQPWSTGGRHLEVHVAQQVLLLVSGGRVIRAIHVSTAAPGHVTPTGTFNIYRKERMSWSVPFQVWMPYASYFTGGYALHEYPDVPPYPASHGCIRVPAGDAVVVWRFAAIGTRVIIH
jgi:L,D-transpeptidase catalytic domain/Putative peptidoglycan binding domain